MVSSFVSNKHCLKIMMFVVRSASSCLSVNRSLIAIFLETLIHSSRYFPYIALSERDFPSRDRPLHYQLVLASSWISFVCISSYLFRKYKTTNLYTSVHGETVKVRVTRFTETRDASAPFVVSRVHDRSSVTRWQMQSSPKNASRGAKARDTLNPRSVPAREKSPQLDANHFVIGECKPLN